MTLIFGSYDQAALDAAYDQNVYAPNREVVNRRNVANSDAARARIGMPERHAYGPSPVEYVEWYRTATAHAPIFVFVRGGAWRHTPVDRFGFVAEPFVAAGAHCVLVQYAGVEQVERELRVLAEQVRSAVAWVYRNAGRFGADPERIVVGGHSSGAHMTGVVTITDWEPFGVPDDVVKGALCCSGMYDLHPVALSSRRHYVRFDDDVVAELSAQRHLDRITIPLIVAYGTEESPEFQRQNREFAAALQAAGKRVRLLVGEGYNHFEIIETLGNPYGLLGHAALDLVR